MAKPRIKSKPAGESVAFEIKLKARRPESTYTLEIIKGGATAKTLSGPWKDGKDAASGIKISGSQATVTWKAEGPEPTGKERAHRVSAKIKLTDKNDKVIDEASQEIDVYHDTIEVQVEDDDGAVKGAAFKVLVDKRPQAARGKTDDEGKAKVKPVKAGTIGLEFQKPYQLDQIVEQTATTLKAKVVVAKKASIISPKPKKGEKFIKQWVNLEASNHRELPNCGKKVKVELQLKDGKQGDRIYVRQSLTNPSKRDDGQLGLETGNGLDAEVIEVEVDAKGKATVDVQLGAAGGTVVELEVGGNKKVADAKLKFVTWRKVFYEIAHPRNVTLPDLALFKRCYREVFVEVEELKAQRTAFELSRFSKGVHPARHFGPGLEGEFLNIGSHNNTTADAFYRGEKLPKPVHVVFCHVLMESGAAKTGSTSVKKGDVVTFGEPGASAPGGMVVFDTPIFPLDLTTGQTAFVRGSWQEAGGSRSGSLSAADVDPQFRYGAVYFLDFRYAVNVKLPDAAARVLAEGKKVNVSLTMKTLSYDGSGWAVSNPAKQLYTLFVVAKGGWRGGDTNPRALNIILAHEFGHILKQAVRLRPGVGDSKRTGVEPPPGLSESDHGWQYDDKVSHTGRHCAFGLTAGSARSEYGDKGAPGTGTLRSFAGLSKTTCVMYGEIDILKPLSTGLFCEKCKPFVMAQDLWML